LGKYKADLSHGQAASTLSGLARQIRSAAKDAGQNVALPRAPANSGGTAPPPVATPAPTPGKVNVTA